MFNLLVMAEGSGAKANDPWADFVQAQYSRLPPDPCMPHQLDETPEEIERIVREMRRDHNGSEIFWDNDLAPYTSLPPDPCKAHQLDVTPEQYEDIVRERRPDHNGSKICWGQKARRTERPENFGAPAAAAHPAIRAGPRDLLRYYMDELFAREENGSTEYVLHRATGCSLLVQTMNKVGVAVNMGSIVDVDPKEVIDRCFDDTRFNFDVRLLCGEYEGFADCCTAQQFDVSSNDRCVDYIICKKLFLTHYAQNLCSEAQKKRMDDLRTVALLFRKIISHDDLRKHFT